VLDFVQPSRGALDAAYPVVKFTLAKGGYLSQFVNFKKFNHDARGQRFDAHKSGQILQGVARQILQKCGVRLWWANITPELPLPAMFVGIDVFHAPMKYNKETKNRERTRSCAAIIVEVIRDTVNKTKLEIYSRTYMRAGGEEYKLEDPLKETIAQAVKLLKVQPKSVIVWRDGIGETTFAVQALKEIEGVKAGLAGATVGADSAKPKVPLSYIVCQKRISTKFLVEQGKDTHGAPAGTLVSTVTGLNHPTFYINGTSPSFSTPKPTRFTVIQTDEPLKGVNLASLSWVQCYDYPNWTGPIKVPATVQMAHKLAELGGMMEDCGASVNADKYVNKPFFL
jgi:aubergine-like protein